MRVEVLVALALVTTVGAVGLAAQKGGGSGGGGGGRVTTPVKTTVGAELRLSRESANPNGIAQIKVSLTEPKPISTGFYDFSGGFDDFMGISCDQK